MSRSRHVDLDAEFLIRIPPYYYLHVLDQNTNVSRLETGPQTYVRQDNERIVLGPEKMITVPPRNYCIIENPVTRDKDGVVVQDKGGEAKLQFGDQDIRLYQDPFPLYPGEVLKQAVSPLKTVAANAAFRLRAIQDYEDENGEKRVVGDKFLFEGPGTYLPRKEVVLEEMVHATIIAPNQAVKLRACKACIDREGNARVTGEEWLVKKIGAYLPGAYEEVAGIVKAYVLTDKKALRMKAMKTFKDDFGVLRKNGEEWLIKMTDTEAHIPGVYEEVIGVVNITTLTNRQYCVVLDPVDENGKPQLGRKRLYKGEKSFFLMPGEQFEDGTQDMHVLGENEGLVLRAKESFKDSDDIRKPGDRWMLRGPAEYIPPVEVEIVSKRVAIPLNENEGIYVRDIKTGKVRSIQAETYMLNQDEELWEKTLPSDVEGLLQKSNIANTQRDSNTKDSQSSSLRRRERSRVITLKVPHNSAVQIYDYKLKKARVIFGPELVMLCPDEQFTQLSLSGGKPKIPNQTRSLFLKLGPSFCTDVFTVETADHARLQIQLSYNWHFEIADKSDTKEAAKLFSVPDFVGDACRAIASLVRGAVASVKFDHFHKNSFKIIQTSVFGIDGYRNIKDKLVFPQNNLVLTSVDVQSLEAVDTRTKTAMQRIPISTDFWNTYCTIL